MSETASQLPRWQCHKRVQADRIVEVLVNPGAPNPGDHVRWRLEMGHVVSVSPALANRVPAETDPVGGYYVLYDDSFESWSPAKAFDEGYTRL